MTDTRTFVIVGAGQAGGWAARTLRDRGFEGRIVLIGDENYPPYERPPLSKEALLGTVPVEKCYLWPPESWQEKGIELKLGSKARRIDKGRREVVLEDGTAIAYDRLLIATGTRPRVLAVPGNTLEGVYYIRYIPDTLAIRAHLPKSGERALVVGGGWIGLEAAAALRKLGIEVVLVEAADRLCSRAATPALSEWLLALHRGHGADIRLGCGVERFEGNAKLACAILTDGSKIETTLAIVGIGVVPNVEIAAEAGLKVANGIVVDERCRSSDPLIFAAGDVSSHPNSFAGRPVRLESWENAQNQGIAAARSMLDEDAPYDEVCWFWSDQYDANIQLIGLPENWDDEVTRGELTGDQFITFYLKQGLLCGAVAVNAGRDLRFARRLMQMRKAVDAAQLADPATKLQNLLKS